MKQIEVSVGDTINPLNTLYLDKGELSVYILIDKDDKQDVDPKLANGLYLKCNDFHNLKDLNRTFSYTVTDGDMTTFKGAGSDASAHPYFLFCKPTRFLSRTIPDLNTILLSYLI